MGFVVFKNPVIPDGYAYVTGGEYLFHSESKQECWKKLDEVYEEGMGVFLLEKIQNMLIPMLFSLRLSLCVKNLLNTKKNRMSKLFYYDHGLIIVTAFLTGTKENHFRF